LLNLQTYRGISIITPRELLDRLASAWASFAHPSAAGVRGGELTRTDWLWWILGASGPMRYRQTIGNSSPVCRQWHSN